MTNHSTSTLSALVLSLISTVIFSQNDHSHTENDRQKKKYVRQAHAKVDRLTVIVDSLRWNDEIWIPKVMDALQELKKSQIKQDSLIIASMKRDNNLNMVIKEIENKMISRDSTNNEILNMLVLVENKIVTLTKTYKEMSNLNSGSDNIVGQEIQKFDTELYAKSLGNFQKEYFQEAIVGFQKLVLMDNDHSLADNSQYWLAECYYAQKDYKKAIFEFEKVFTYAGTDKEDDAMLKIAYSYQSMGNVEKASENFKRLIDYKPGSEFYPLAKQRLKQLSVN